MLNDNNSPILAGVRTYATRNETYFGLETPYISTRPHQELELKGAKPLP